MIFMHPSIVALVVVISCATVAYAAYELRQLAAPNDRNRLDRRVLKQLRGRYRRAR